MLVGGGGGYADGKKKEDKHPQKITAIKYEAWSAGSWVGGA